MRLALGLAISFMAVVTMPSRATAQEFKGELEIIRPDSLSVTYERDEADAGTVWIKNSSTGSEVASVSFSANVQTSDGKGEPVVTSSTIRDIGPNQVERFPIRLSNVDRGRLQGELIATARGYAPASVDLIIGPKRDFGSWINAALLAPLVVALLLIGARWLSIKRGLPEASLGGRVGEAKFDFSKSFASTITVVGALLGTVLTAGVLPEEPDRLTKNEYLSLNLLFGVAVVVAGVVFAASERPTDQPAPKVGTDREYRGSVKALLMSACLVVWATIGQAFCLALIISELPGTTAFTPVAMVVFWALLLVAMASVLRYTYRRIFWVIENKAEISTKSGTSQPAGSWTFF